jgi:hypothetical protein
MRRCAVRASLTIWSRRCFRDAFVWRVLFVFEFLPVECFLRCFVVVAVGINVVGGAGALGVANARSFGNPSGGTKVGGTKVGGAKTRGVTGTRYEVETEFGRETGREIGTEVGNGTEAGIAAGIAAGIEAGRKAGSVGFLPAFGLFFGFWITAHSDGLMGLTFHPEGV